MIDKLPNLVTVDRKRYDLQRLVLVTGESPPVVVGANVTRVIPQMPFALPYQELAELS
jgi:hypothetical protein